MSNSVPSSSNEIYIGNDSFPKLEEFLAKNYPGRKIFLLVDENTREKCIPLILKSVAALKNATLLEIKSGEKNKSLLACEKLWQQLTEHQADRTSVLINLGGGMVSDVGGFVAATYMRGIDFINIPTTLLAMVDASAGGKNGINFSGLKNQVGTFTKPRAVFISPSFLKTLPERELKSGFAEVIKHTLIADREKWNEVKLLDNFIERDWIRIIGDSIDIKNKIVTADYREQNIRKTLNFGHTIGHALESYSLKHDADPLKHGEAIALGIVGEIFLSQKMLDFPGTDADEIISFIQKHYDHFSMEADVDEVLEFIRSDKKNEQSITNFVLLKNIGDPVINQNPGEAITREAVEFTLQRIKSIVQHS